MIGQERSYPFGKPLRFLFFGSFFLLYPVEFSAQTTNLGNDVYYLERQLKVLQSQSKKPMPAFALDWRRIDQDFKALQVANNELHQAVFLDRTTDSKYLDGILKRINKSASRLKSFLTLPAAEVRGENDEISGVSFENLARLLDETVLRFKGNPVFKETHVLNMENGVQAKKDLQLIIRLSDLLRKR